VLAGYWRFRGSLNDLPQTAPGDLRHRRGRGRAPADRRPGGHAQLRPPGHRGACRCRHKVVDFYDRFEEGVFGSVGAKGLPLLGVLTIVIWMTEALRLYFVVRALGFGDVDLGLSGAMFVALIGSLADGASVHAGRPRARRDSAWAVLTQGLQGEHAPRFAIVLVDRAISVFSIVVFGSIAYVISSKPRGGGMRSRRSARPSSRGLSLSGAPGRTAERRGPERVRGDAAPRCSRSSAPIRMARPDLAATLPGLAGSRACA
jgi:hypothetical protein